MAEAAEVESAETDVDGGGKDGFAWWWIPIGILGAVIIGAGVWIALLKRKR